MDVTDENGQVQQVEKELFCPLPYSTAGRVAILFWSGIRGCEIEGGRGSSFSSDSCEE